MNNEHEQQHARDDTAHNRRRFLAGTLGAMAAVPLMTGIPGIARAQSATPVSAAGRGRRPQRWLGPLEVSPIGLGCMAMAPGFYNPAPERAAMVRLIRDAHRTGVTFFDTAEVYGPFISEEIVGEALAPIRNEVVLATKFGFSYNGSSVTGRNSQPAHIKTRVEGMLQRLRTDRIDLLYLHRMDPNVAIADIAGAVGDLISDGKVRAFGVSEVNPDTLRGAHAVTPVAAVQSEYSLLERLPEVAMLDTCAELGIGFVPWGPTMRGLLADGFNGFSRFATQDRRAAVPFFTPEALETNLKIVALARLGTAQGRDAGADRAGVAAGAARLHRADPRHHEMAAPAREHGRAGGPLHGRRTGRVPRRAGGASHRRQSSDQQGRGKRMKTGRMKTLIAALAMLATPFLTKAQTMPDPTMTQRLQQLEDRVALKTLVDTFSNLADTKSVNTQVLLFTEDATVDSWSEGKQVSSFTGRKQIGEAFSAYLALFDTVYHMNGQQTVELDGDRATGISYCLVVLIGKDGDKRYRNTAGVIYQDEYVRRDGRWMIAKRVSDFTWRSRDEVPAAAEQG